MREALRVTKGGGFMVTSDLFKGEGPFVSAEEFKTFSSSYMVHDWQTPDQSVKTAQLAGWTDVQYFDFTDEIKVRVVHLGRSTCHAISGRGDKSTRIPGG